MSLPGRNKRARKTLFTTFQPCAIHPDQLSYYTMPAPAPPEATLSDLYNVLCLQGSEGLHSKKARDRGGNSNFVNKIYLVAIHITEKASATKHYSTIVIEKANKREDFNFIVGPEGQLTELIQTSEQSFSLFFFAFSFPCRVHRARPQIYSSLGTQQTVRPTL